MSDNERPSDAKRIARREFDDLCRQKQFSEGPFISGFGDGRGEPYVPNRERNVWGKTVSGENVWAGPTSQDVVKKDEAVVGSSHPSGACGCRECQIDYGGGCECELCNPV